MIAFGRGAAAAQPKQRYASHYGPTSRDKIASSRCALLAMTILDGWAGDAMHKAEWSIAAPKLMQEMMHSAAAEAHQMCHLRSEMMVSREAFRRRGRRFPAI